MGGFFDKDNHLLRIVQLIGNTKGVTRIRIRVILSGAPFWR